jgi:hypothetical protein
MTTEGSTVPGEDERGDVDSLVAAIEAQAVKAS